MVGRALAAGPAPRPADMTLTAVRSGLYIGGWGETSGVGTVGSPGGAWYGRDLTAAYTAFETWRGRPIDVCYTPLGASDINGIKGLGNTRITAANGLPMAMGSVYRNRLMVNVIGNPTDGPDYDVAANDYGCSSWWANAAAGNYDGWYLTLMDNIAAAGVTRVVLRLWWEHNLNTGAHVVQPWGVNSQIDVTNFITTWRRLIPAMKARQTGVHVTVCWCPGGSNGQVTAYGAPSYPGDDVVDVIGIDTYPVDNHHFPISELPAWSPEGTYGLGTTVGGVAGWFTSRVAGNTGNALPALTGSSTAHWQHTPYPALPPETRSALDAARQRAIAYTFDGSATNPRRINYWKRFADGTATDYVLDSRATRSGRKPFALCEWGVQSTARCIEPKDAPEVMAAYRTWINANMSGTDGVSFECYFHHDIGMPTPSQVYSFAPPTGDYGAFPTAAPLAMPNSAAVYRADFPNG